MHPFQYRRWRRYHKNNGSSNPPRTIMMVAALQAVFISLLIVAAFVVVGYYHAVSQDLPKPEEMIAQHGGGARILDRNGQLLYQFLDEKWGQQEWVDLENVSDWFVQATLAVEDPTFYSNPGVNIKGIARATYENLLPGDDFFKGSGGSSITQQLVRLIYFSPEERAQRTIDRKLKEMAISLEITGDYNKDQILEWYVNEAPYGSTFVGVGIAAQRYFSVPASQLTLPQAAFLAGLPQSPAEYDPFTNFEVAKARQDDVLGLMVRHGFITQAQADFARLFEVQLTPSIPPFHAPHFVVYVADYIRATLGEDALLHGGLEVWTTLDLSLNQRANEILENHLREHEESTNAHNGAVVVIEPQTGQILAMVGSRDYWRDDIQGQVNNAVGLNSPGSTLKPFTYVTAFIEGWGPDWPVIDSRITYEEPDGKTFTPRNPGNGQTYGMLPVKKALGNSLNIPAFKTILWVGVDRMVATARAMGITSLEGRVGPAVTLGGTDVKLLDMTYAYSVFANGGTMAGAPTVLNLPVGNRTLDSVSVLQVKDLMGRVLVDNSQSLSAPVIGPQYSYLITDILSNEENRSLIFGSDATLTIPGWQTAVKTGTSEPFEVDPNESEKLKPTSDTWSFGYTTDVAVGVWIGNSDNSRMKNMYSTTIASPVWHDVMLAALEGKQPRAFPRPDGLVVASVCVPSGKRATPEVNCPSVRGLFVEEALARQNDRLWGGHELAALPSDSCPTCIPEEITGWKRYLANEYLRYFGIRPRTSTTGDSSPSGQPPASSPPAQQSPGAAPTQPPALVPTVQPPEPTTAPPPSPGPTSVPDLHFPSIGN